MDKIKKAFAENNNKIDEQSIIKVGNGVIGTDKKQIQKEIYKGNFSLGINSEMPIELQI